MDAACAIVPMTPRVEASTEDPMSASKAGSSPGAQSGPGAPQVHCPKCGESVTSETLAATTQAKRKFSLGQDADCAECMNNYKALTRRWKCNRRLQTWFNGLAADEQKDWFSAQKEISAKLTSAEKRAAKRKLNMVSVREHKKQKGDKNIFHWEPWTAHLACVCGLRS